MLQYYGKKYAEERRTNDTTLFDSAAYVEAIRCAAIILHCSFHASMEGSDQAEQVWRAPYAREHWLKPSCRGVRSVLLQRLIRSGGIPSFPGVLSEGLVQFIKRWLRIQYTPI